MLAAILWAVSASPARAQDSEEDESDEAEIQPQSTLTQPSSRPREAPDSVDSEPSSQLSFEHSRMTGLQSHTLGLATPGLKGQLLQAGFTLSQLEDADATRELSVESKHSWAEAHSWAIQGSYTWAPDDIRAWSVSPSTNLSLSSSEDWGTQLGISTEFERAEQTVASKKGRSKSLGTNALGGALSVTQKLTRPFALELSFEKKFFVGTVPGKLEKLRQGDSALVAGLRTENLSFSLEWELSEEISLQTEAARTKTLLDSVAQTQTSTDAYSLELNWTAASWLAVKSTVTELLPEGSSLSTQLSVGATVFW